MKLLLLVAILLVVDGSRSTPVPQDLGAKGKIVIQLKFTGKLEFSSFVDLEMAHWKLPAGLADAIQSERQVNATTTASTTINWAEQCQILCKQGQGGLLCDCDMIPVKVH